MTLYAFKFALDPTHGGQHAIPRDAKFMDMQVQRDAPVMWWAVPWKTEPRSEWPLRTFSVAVTGMPGFTENLHYVGTFQLGDFVGHVMSWEAFERLT